MNLARLLKRAEELGIDLPSHRCDCEACSRTSIPCPATISSIIAEVVSKTPAQPEPRYDDVFFDGVAWLDTL